MAPCLSAWDWLTDLFSASPPFHSNSAMAVLLLLSLTQLCSFSVANQQIRDLSCVTQISVRQISPIVCCTFKQLLEENPQVFPRCLPLQKTAIHSWETPEITSELTGSDFQGKPEISSKSVRERRLSTWSCAIYCSKYTGTFRAVLVTEWMTVVTAIQIPFLWLC